MSDKIQARVTLGDYLPRTGLRCEEAGFGTAESFNGGLITLSREAFKVLSAAYPGLLTEKKKPGRKPAAVKPTKVEA